MGYRVVPTVSLIKDEFICVATRILRHPYMASDIKESETRRNILVVLIVPKKSETLDGRLKRNSSREHPPASPGAQDTDPRKGPPHAVPAQPAPLACAGNAAPWRDRPWPEHLWPNPAPYWLCPGKQVTPRTEPVLSMATWRRCICKGEVIVVPCL